MDKHVTIITDGACSPNPGRGGWAYKVRHSEGEYSGRGSVDATTNNRMELQAVLEGLRSLKRTGCKVTIRTDSQCVIAGCERNGWKYANGTKKTPPANWDLVQQVMAEMMKHEVRFEWVRGHSGDLDNEHVDEIAQRMSA